MSNPVKYLPLLGAVLFTALSGYGLHSCTIQRLEKRQEKAITAEKLACIVQEQKHQNITTGASNVFQNGLSQLERDYAGVMQQRSCVSIIDTGSATNRPDAGTGKGKPSAYHAIHSDKLYGYARQCEIDRLKVIGLQKFILDERK